jgi:hypothetical protein
MTKQNPTGLITHQKGHFFLPKKEVQLFDSNLTKRRRRRRTSLTLGQSRETSLAAK